MVAFVFPGLNAALCNRPLSKNFQTMSKTFKVVSLNYLEIMENSLKSETDALGTVVRFCRHLVHRLAQRVREVQHLQTKQE